MDNNYTGWNDSVSKNLIKNTNEIINNYNNYSNVFNTLLNETISIVNDNDYSYKSIKKELIELKAKY